MALATHSDKVSRMVKLSPLAIANMMNVYRACCAPHNSVMMLTLPTAPVENKRPDRDKLWMPQVLPIRPVFFHFIPKYLSSWGSSVCCVSCHGNSFSLIWSPIFRLSL